MNNTKNKIALVTGGSRGIGENIALSLAQNGVDVIITYNSKKESALRVVSALEQLGVKAAALQLNTSGTQGFDAFFSELKTLLTSHFEADRFDFLVNNAGTGLRAPLSEATEAQFDEMLNIHFKGVFFLTQKALSLLNDGGGIVNISSGLARFTFPGSGVYAAMKGAVETFTRYLALELGPRGINANVVAPGAIATDFNGGLVRDNADINKTVAGHTALGRVGLASDIGGVVAFLCSPAAKWVTAQRIEASGGMNI